MNESDHGENTGVGVISCPPCVFTRVVVNGAVKSRYVQHSPSEVWRVGRAPCVEGWGRGVREGQISSLTFDLVLGRSS